MVKDHVKYGEIDPKSAQEDEEQRPYVKPMIEFNEELDVYVLGCTGPQSCNSGAQTV